MEDQQVLPGGLLYQKGNGKMENEANSKRYTTFKYVEHGKEDGFLLENLTFQ